MADLKKLKVDAKGFSVLYVEDNDTLRKNASKLLKKFFDVVYLAEDGKEGLEAFKEFSPSIVVTDIKMPKMDGMELAKEIRNYNSDAKVIIMSAFDDSSYLYGAIELGVYRYLKKPVNITNFAEVLHECILDIKKKQNTQIFNTHLKNIFNYQSSIVLLMEGSEPVFANQMFLDYFNVADIEDFLQKYHNLGKLFLEHDSFLYDMPDRNWFDAVSKNPQKLFNIKIKDKDENFKHFILKYQKIPDEESYGILSFDDITELNLLKLYDASQVKSDESAKDSKTMYKLLEVIQRNNAKIELHNFYKGISITNDAVIVNVTEDYLILKTDYMQEKAIQLDNKSFITSDALPSIVACDGVTNISFEKQSVEFTNIHFTTRSPVDRKAQRVVPEENHTVSLFLGTNKFHGDVSIEDISLEAVKLNLEAMPIGLKISDEVVVNMVLPINNKPIIINTKAIMLRKSLHKRTVSIVFKFVFKVGEKVSLASYITNRQMEIIREFKGMQNG